MIDQRLHGAEMLSENRDEIFLHRFAEAAAQLQTLGIQGKTLKQMLTVLPFVRAWIDTPFDFYLAEKLPKGYKWSDGTRYQEKRKGVYSSTDRRQSLD